MTHIKKFNESKDDFEESRKFKKSEIDRLIDTLENGSNHDIVNFQERNYKSEQSENDDTSEANISRVNVKDLIDYLSQYDMNMIVSLDKDGWDYEKTALKTIENSGLFDKFENTLIINN